jgi:uncharacterized protein (DUF58 family)
LLSEAVILLVVLLFVAAIVKGGFAFTIFYLFLGVYIISLVWTRHSAANLTCERKFEKRAFWGEEVPVSLQIKNKGWLPIPWLYIYESLPTELSGGSFVKRVFSLGPHGAKEIQYRLSAFKRGHYAVGPFTTKYGDTLGLADVQELEKQADYITVYPRIIPLAGVDLPSRSPIGTLKHHQPIFEDPSRVRGKRDYTASDSLRRVDWKASAAAGRLLVKQFEPSISLQTSIFVNLNYREYPRHHIDATELSIVVAASLANWVVEQKQSVGLVSNGRMDSHAKNVRLQPIFPRKGRSQLIRILDTLARIQGQDSEPIKSLLSRETPNLPWGTTIVVITGEVNEPLFDELFAMKRRGQNVTLIITGHSANIRLARQQARQFGFPIYAFPNEKGLDMWRRK